MIAKADVYKIRPEETNAILLESNNNDKMIYDKYSWIIFFI